MAAVAGKARAVAAPGAGRRSPARSVRAPRVANGVVWIVVLAAVLAGVVAVNVAVLRLNLQLDDLNRKRTDLKERITNAEYTISRMSATGSIEQQARSEGLVESPSVSFVHLGAGR